MYFWICLCYRWQSDGYRQHTCSSSEWTPQWHNFLSLVMVPLTNAHSKKTNRVKNFPPQHKQIHSYLKNLQTSTSFNVSILSYFLCFHLFVFLDFYLYVFVYFFCLFLSLFLFKSLSTSFNLF